MDVNAKIADHSRPLTALSVIFALSVAVCAQQVSSQPPIQANAHLALVPVTVTDKKGEIVDGLTLDDFLLTDDGVKQPVHLDTSDVVVAPVSIVVAVECSAISSPALAKINKVGGMIQPLITGDRGKAAVIAYDDEVRVFQEFTSDSSKVRVAFERIEGHSTRHVGKMIDAVAEGVEMLENRPANARRIILVIGESRDRGSRLKLPAVIQSAQRAGVMIYSATYSVYATPWTARPEDNPPVPGTYLDGVIDLMRLGKINTADAFARTTGGRHLAFETLNGLENSIERAGEEIHSQYLLSFVPRENGNQGFHRVEVSVIGRSGLTIRARPGYWPER